MTRKTAFLAALSACAVLGSMTATERAAGRYLRAPDHDAGTKSAAELAAEIKADHQRAIDAVKSIAEEALGKAKSGEQLSTSLKEKADEALVKMNEFSETVARLEQKMQRGGGEADRQKSYGEQFVDGEGFQSWKESGFSKNYRGADLKIKATLTSATTDSAGSVGDAIAPTRLPGVLELPQRRLTVRDLIAPGQMGGNTLEYVKETGFTNNAGMVAEAAAKPESDMKLDLVTTSAKVIAHWMKASKQVLDDIPQLRSMIDQRLGYGLALKEESQILNGDNTGQNLNGIIPQATSFSAPVALGDLNIIDVLRLAMLQAALAEYPATGHVLNPTDWAYIETLKDSIGRYIIGNPQGQTTPTLWSLPVVATQSIAAKKFLTGSFRQAAQLFDRWESRIEVGYVNDDFTKNLVTILGEERIALAVYRPEAFIYGDFDTALAA
ncbi:phage major capsid protein [Rhizobium sp. G21]|uniref:phage major capsid protein n=1 Tax=Rhizobium sp. G21 TaxID=2758439 RepID=UPI0016021096|nr:phage major capsid protein [Rhizobium sp. G21]MBB1247450.1 phage major capsid protein [Rhizobium sp. G21]